MRFWDIIILIIALIIIISCLYVILYAKNLKRSIKLRTLDANVKRIELSKYPEKKLPWNPSIVEFDNKFIIAYRLTHARLLTGTSQLGIIEMNKDTFEIQREYVFPNVPKKQRNIHGYEDPRIFKYDGKIYVFAVVYTQLAIFNSCARIHLLEIDTVSMKIIKDLEIKTSYEDETQSQKNWTYLKPGNSNNEILAVVKVEPLTIISLNVETGENKKLSCVSCKKLKHKFKTLESKLIHGGTAPIKLGEKDKYVAIAHTKTKGFGMKYGTIFYEFIEEGETYKITRFSNEFAVESKGPNMADKIQMVIGMEHLNDKEVIITLGINDNDMFGITFDKDKIEKLLDENIIDA